MQSHKKKLFSHLYMQLCSLILKQDKHHARCEERHGREHSVVDRQSRVGAHCRRRRRGRGGRGSVDTVPEEHDLSLVNDKPRRRAIVEVSNQRRVVFVDVPLARDAQSVPEELVHHVTFG